MYKIVLLCNIAKGCVMHYTVPSNVVYFGLDAQVVMKKENQSCFTNQNAHLI